MIRGSRNLLLRPRQTVRHNDVITAEKTLGVLSADGLVMAEAAFPHVVCPGPREQEPAGLDRQRLHEFSPFQSAEEDRDWTKQFVVERQPFHHGLDGRRHDVDRKHLATEEVFERINDEHDGGDFQNPKRHHRQAVSDKELNERRHEHRHRGFGWDNNDKPGVQLNQQFVISQEQLEQIRALRES